MEIKKSLFITASETCFKETPQIEKQEKWRWKMCKQDSRGTAEFCVYRFLHMFFTLPPLKVVPIKVLKTKSANAVAILWYLFADTDSLTCNAKGTK